MVDDFDEFYGEGDESEPVHPRSLQRSRASPGRIE
jgi:hypothetical protein